MPHRNRQQGFSAIYVSFLVMFFTLSIGANIFLVASNSQRVIANNSISLQALYAAESGIEDATFRIKNLLTYSPVYTILVGSAQSQVSVSGNGNMRTVESKGTAKNSTRKLQATLTLNTVAPQFFFGAQVGEGGFIMGQNSRVEGIQGSVGNIYSHGSVVGDNGATITGDAAVAGLHSLDSVVVLGSARAHAITNSKICGDAYYQIIDVSSVNFLNSPSSATCPLPLTPGTGHAGQPDPSLQNPAISQANIDQWKTDAAAGGTIAGNCGDSGVAGCVIENDGILSLGPKKITGSLVLTKKQTLVVTGTLHIQGSISMDSGSGATIKCDPSFNTTSCVIVSDSWIHVKNNSLFQGSGQSGSFVMLLTTLAGCSGGNQQPQCTHHNGAIDIHNNATGAIFYTSGSLANVHNGVTVTEITAYKLNLDNNTVIQYEQGLLNAQFSSGPGATFEVVSWKETE